ELARACWISRAEGHAGEAAERAGERSVVRGALRQLGALLEQPPCRLVVALTKRQYAGSGEPGGAQVLGRIAGRQELFEVATALLQVTLPHPEVDEPVL